MRRGVPRPHPPGTGNDGFYGTKNIGAFGVNLGAVACFFEDLWKRLAPGLSEPVQAWLLHQAAYDLRALGRLPESLEPMRVSGEIHFKLEEWKGASISYRNLSELELTLGDLRRRQEITFTTLCATCEAAY